MKKLFLFVVVMVLVLSASSLRAEDDRAFDVYIGGGIVTDDSFTFKPMIWTAGITLDFHLGDYIMLSPEGFIIVEKFTFDPFWVAPACLLNIKLNSFFFGAGLTKWFLVGDERDISTDIALKANAGFVGDNFRLTAFAVTDFDNLFKKGMVVGATLSIGF